MIGIGGWVFGICKVKADEGSPRCGRRRCSALRGWRGLHRGHNAFEAQARELCPLQKNGRLAAGAVFADGFVYQRVEFATRKRDLPPG
jgi:hypothetical protein